MAYPADPRLVVITCVRLKGFADVGPIVDASGLDEATVSGVLADLGAQDLARHREGRVSGWTLTPAGRALHAELVVAELAAAACGPDVDVAYREFLGLNPRLLTTASAWQLRKADGEAVVNDHTDAGHDARVIGELRALHDEAAPLVSRLGSLLGRFGRYELRLSNAVGRVEAGDHDWFTKPLIDSYHTVWFELHEDLLSTLGKERASEESKELA
ncbi:MAG: transcriptional regulator [Acidimicrobiia bacterium]|nr:transcriptional regulator [Acidimicrobiia bacterium]